MPQGGEISIKTCREENNFIARIKDSGCGIPKSNINKIFDPFFTTKDKGTGMGLAICFSIIKAHNGTITVESKENRGTTMTVKLPLEM